jgi:hypothetical protein
MATPEDEGGPTFETLINGLASVCPDTRMEAEAMLADMEQDGDEGQTMWTV